MPSQAQLSRVEVIDRVGKVANRTAILHELVKTLESREIPAVTCKAWSNLNFSVPGGAVWTPVQFTQTIYDMYSMFVLTSPTRLTCVIPGKYKVSACAKWASSVSSANGSGLRLRANGSLVFAEFEVFSADIRSMTVSGNAHLASAGEYIELLAENGTVNPVNLLTLSEYSPVLAISL